MRQFIHRENIKHYTELLSRTTDATERARIMNLLAEEVVKDLDQLSGLESSNPTVKL